MAGKTPAIFFLMSMKFLLLITLPLFLGLSGGTLDSTIAPCCKNHQNRPRKIEVVRRFKRRKKKLRKAIQ